MTLEHFFLVSALTAYTVGTVVLLVYFFNANTWLRNWGAILAATGCLAQFCELGARWMVSGIWPLTNLYGSLSLFAAMGVAIFLAFAWRYRIWFAGGFVLLIASLTLAYATTWNEGTMPPVPALQSYWIKIHVPLVISAYAAFMLAFVMSLLYLLKFGFEHSRRTPRAAEPLPALAGAQLAVDATLETGDARIRILQRKNDTPNIAAAAVRGDHWARWLEMLPSLAKLDVLSYRSVSVGLPLLTVGIITGAWWAKEAWGAYWQWDPKETAALASWIAYASFMHLHTRNQWRGYRCAVVSVFAFASVVFCYLGVNIWVSGLHSYKF